MVGPEAGRVRKADRRRSLAPQGAVYQRACQRVADEEDAGRWRGSSQCHADFYLSEVGEDSEELIKTNLTLKDYSGKTQNVCGGAVMEVTVGSKTIPTTFFVIEGKGSYTALLGRDWIHANCCIVTSQFPRPSYIIKRALSLFLHKNIIQSSLKITFFA